MKRESKKSNHASSNSLFKQEILDISLASISGRRTELMGIAILGVVLFHSQVDFSELFYLSPFQTIKSIGYGGVDLFFFLSGFGLACGWLNKKYNLWGFYKRRIFRILPIYCFWMFLYGIIQLIVFNNFRVRGFIADFLGLGFLSGRNYNNWFIPALLICYLIFPFIISVFSSNTIRKLASKGIWLIILSTTFLPLGICLILILVKANVLLIFFTRLPNFILGTFLGLALIRDNLKTLRDLNCNLITLVSILVLGFCCLYLSFSVSPEINWLYGLWWYPFILFTFPFCLILASLLDGLDQQFSDTKIFSCIHECLCFCGQYSLEIYLVHGLVFQFSPYLHQAIVYCVTSKNNLLEYSILIPFSVLLAYFLNKSFNGLRLQLKSKY